MILFNIDDAILFFIGIAIGVFIVVVVEITVDMFIGVVTGNKRRPDIREEHDD